MLYQLPNGKVIEISLDQYLDMSDADFEAIISYNLGHELENPFFGSILGKSNIMVLDEDVQDSEKELPDIEYDEKLNDEDFYRDDT